MNLFRFLMPVCCFAFLSMACNQQAGNSVSNTDSAQTGKDINADSEIVMGLLYQQRAAEYRALCLQDYNIARINIAHVNKTIDPHKRLAVVTDLDETALDNSSNEARYYLLDSSAYLVQRFTAWYLKEQAAAVPGSVDFFKYVDGLNKGAKRRFDIYYISNRKSDSTIIRATMENMDRLGFPESKWPADTAHFLFSVNGEFSKQRRRDSVRKKVDSIVLLLGDNLVDLDSAFDHHDKLGTIDYRNDRVENMKDVWGGRYIVFPNAYYGDWESVMYGWDSKIPFSQKYQIRRSALDTMDRSHER